MAKKKVALTNYRVTCYGPTGAVETVYIQADDIGRIGEYEDPLIVFYADRRPVYTLRSSAFERAVAVDDKEGCAPVRRIK